CERGEEEVVGSGGGGRDRDVGEVSEVPDAPGTVRAHRVERPRDPPIATAVLVPGDTRAEVALCIARVLCDGFVSGWCFFRRLAGLCWLRIARWFAFVHWLWLRRLRFRLGTLLVHLRWFILFGLRGF